jgi:hypothetical protein
MLTSVLTMSICLLDLKSVSQSVMVNICPGISQGYQVQRPLVPASSSRRYSPVPELTEAELPARPHQ